jgi:putative sigma-54 modulation protein
MEMHVTGKNLELTPEAREYISRKMGKINRFLPSILSFDVVASQEQTRSPSQRFVVQVTLDSNGTLIRGEERGQDVHSAVDKVFEVMSRQIEHYKGKLPYAKAKGSRTPSIRTSTTEVVESEAAKAEETGPKIVKNKRFEVKPMSLDEAIDQMQLLGHDFFLYYDPDVNKMNLIYKRKDGNLGLIEPNITK